MNKRALDLLIVNGGALLALVVVLLGIENGLLRFLVGLPLVFLWPGYALTTLLMPQETDLLRRLAFSLGFSLLVVILGAFLLHWSGWGITPTSWVLLLSGVTLAAGLVALRRRLDNGEAMVDFPAPALTLPQAGMVGTAALIGLVAFGVAYSGATNYPVSNFTQLWLTPVHQDPTAQTFAVGVRNLEPSALTYRLQLAVDGAIAGEWATLPLAPEEEWQATFQLPAGAAPDQHLVEARLFRAEAPETVYRYVVIKPFSPEVQ